MNNDNLSILKVFTRRLANCRYKIQYGKLVSYLGGGKFGFSESEFSDTVITNETVFADELEKTAEHISAIFKAPHIFLKREEVIKNADIANNPDTGATLLNYRDGKIWKIKGKNIAPEYLHTVVYEDNLAIYENRFISKLIDLIIKIIDKKLDCLKVYFDTLNYKIAKQNQIELPVRKYVDYADDEGGIPVLMSSKNPDVIAYGTLLRVKKKLQLLRTKDLYKACEKAGEFDISNIKSTNILMADANYNYCYVFYKCYICREPIFTTESKMYYSFVAGTLFKALSDFGFTPAEEIEDIAINNSAEISFGKLVLNYDPFEVVISQKDERAILLEVTETVDGNKAKYLVYPLSSASKELKNTTPDEFLAEAKENADDDILQIFVMSDVKGEDVDVLNIIPNKSCTSAQMLTLIKTILYRVEGAAAIHTRYCPVCGSHLVSPDYDDYTCAACEARYHLYGYEGRDMIWIKRFPKTTKEDEIDGYRTEDVVDERRLAAEEAAVEEEPAPAVEEKPAPKAEEKPAEEKPAPVTERIIERIIEKIIYKTPEEVKEVVKEEVKTPAKEEVAATAAPVKMSKVMPAPAPVVEPETEEDDEKQTRIGLKKSFTAKMCQGGAENIEYYNAIKNYLLSYKKVYSRVSFEGDTFSSGRLPRIKLAVRGKTLVAFLALNPKDYEDSKYFPHDMGDVKKYEATPMMVKVKSDRGVKHVQELADVIFNSLELKKKKDFVEEKYKFPYKSDKQLLKEGLAKEVEMNLNF